MAYKFGFIVCSPGKAAARVVATILDLPHDGWRQLNSAKDVRHFVRGSKSPVYEFKGANRHPGYREIMEALERLSITTVKVDVHGVRQ